MALRKHKASGDSSSAALAPLNFVRKMPEKGNSAEADMKSCVSLESHVDIDPREVYFLIMHFLSASPCKRTYGQFWNELLEHQLLPRRYHAWYSRSGVRSGDEDDDGKSLPLSYSTLVERYPHVEKDHLVKLFKQLILNCTPQVHGASGNIPNAADVPTLLGSGPFSLLSSDRDGDDKIPGRLPGYLRWPHMQADQVRGLSLREIGGGFTKHHRAPSVRAACYVIAKPSTMVQKMQFTIKLRGHQNAVYCATFDRLGRYVITGSDDRLVKIWSMETAFCLASCRGHEGDITDLAVSSNNALVASSSNDFTIRVWRLPDGLPISVLRGHTGAVTAIAFSPRPSYCYQLLSSSDDGTCRIWDARYSQVSLRIYVPKPPDTAGRVNDTSTNAVQPCHQILCCAFNASGTVFVTGSSDTYARVWNACRNSAEDCEQPNHEMDVLSGHENDVNYVQFSGCAVASKFSSTDTLKEDNIPKFKNSWFTHDNIVTCSRDGSAIIWIPRSRRSHGKVGRWTRAYHLKVPPPPMPPQPPRGGPRQRFQPTPRGVNMIVWSLDNRFVLAAIMDCRICVWNASDGSLVHSLIGHTESTFVLDVHPFNPRIAMSAGYDGKTIIWDIWEGTPVRVYETGRFKLVDGKFSPDGTSLVLSDEVGQIFIIATGQGESRKDAQYDQFFLGDYRPLIQDTNGNVLDQETQLIPYRRNMQDLLCDSSMIPYPEPYQNMYQQRRLGALGIEWHPPLVKFAVGPTYNAHTGDYQILPIVDLDRLIEPLPEIADLIDWEHDNELQSEDTDSEYNATDEYSSEGEHISFSGSSTGEAECSAADSEVDHVKKEGLRRSKRKKLQSELDITTSSGRRVKRRKLDDHDGGTFVSKASRARPSRNGRIAARKKKSTLKSLRPQRRAARNALSLFSQISDGEDEDELESTSSESESLLPDSNSPSNESEGSMKNRQMQHGKGREISIEEHGDAAKPSMLNDNKVGNGSKRRLVLKLKASNFSGMARLECREQGAVMASPVKTNYDSSNFDQLHSRASETANSSAGRLENFISQCGSGARIREKSEMDMSEPVNDLVGHKATMKWGEVKQRSTKRLRLYDASTVDIVEGCGNGNLNWEGGSTSNCENQAIGEGLDKVGNGINGMFENDASTLDNGRGFKNSPINSQQNQFALPLTCSKNRTEAQDDVLNEYEGRPMTSQHAVVDESLNTFEMACDKLTSSSENKYDAGHSQERQKVSQSVFPKLRIKTNGFNKETYKLKSVSWDDCRTSDGDFISNREVSGKGNLMSVVPEEEGTTGDSAEHSDWNNGSDSMEIWTNKSSNRKFSTVYRRSRSSRSRKNCNGEMNAMEESTSNSYNHGGNMKNGYSDALAEDGHERRFTSAMASTCDFGSVTPKFRGNSSSNPPDGRKSISKTTLFLRSFRNRRENHNTGLRPPEKRRYQQAPKKFPWLMLLEHEEAYRFVPQKGDEVAYLRQGHEEFLEVHPLPEARPWRHIEGSLKAVEFCRIKGLDYATVSGSGDSCCKLTLEFIDPNSTGFGEEFKMTLPELDTFPDFLVETTRYVAATARNWTHRDKCQVWWKNADGDGGSWWEGRILAVKPKSPEFPDSPWERFVIQYKNDSGQHLHSPWELYDADVQWDHPRIDERTRNKLLASLDKIEQSSIRNQDYYGIQKLSQVSQKTEFLNRFPVPLSLEAIRRRLENNYYRTVEAVKHDASVMVSNAEAYFIRSVEMSTKIRRLADWVARTFTSL
ncbi:bromodomain and WD repeat-containing protein 3 [Phalaenopsis equestris]|uniref:bromodomain and WD repeat-containing protein 3 n=1 Tax=Phalaenopsis equestris TaxID=78828 RepID=UPI0009E5023E|nr:bromodomain and WD repeat-containing protein 3 [Phalaenopsis equestris]XP_020592279.1 bromodomain and WD repeat-containing protein 3 [Phalaenopsis equestris]XP_020592280.1 bromodomain and WD repeat-containing protein 3 [Phalaenopsis equestris]